MENKITQELGNSITSFSRSVVFKTFLFGCVGGGRIALPKLARTGGS
ncbi:MAG: hypothetical protein Q8N63_03565 [Nanoarchaeota archaeon]|nr:hypothetical protein [Nanoarchaeota archaeon]